MSALTSTVASEPKINAEPTYGKIVVPSELNACANVRRLCAVAGLPSSTISGFATTCTTVIPAASTNSAVRNTGNDATDDAGMNSKQPAHIVVSPSAAACMYPTRSTTRAAGIENTKYAMKNADCTSIASAYVSTKISLSFGMMTSFKLVMPPNTKNSANTKTRRSAASTPAAE